MHLTCMTRGSQNFSMASKHSRRRGPRRPFRPAPKHVIFASLSKKKKNTQRQNGSRMGSACPGKAPLPSPGGPSKTGHSSNTTGRATRCNNRTMT